MAASVLIEAVRTEAFGVGVVVTLAFEVVHVPGEVDSSDDACADGSQVIKDRAAAPIGAVPFTRSRGYVLVGSPLSHQPLYAVPNWIFCMRPTSCSTAGRYPDLPMRVCHLEANIGNILDPAASQKVQVSGYIRRICPRIDLRISAPNPAAFLVTEG